MSRDLFFEVLRYRRKTILILALLLVVNAVLFFVNTYQQQPVLEQARSEWSARRQATLSTNPRSQIAVYSKNTADLAAFRERIPPKSELPTVLGDLFQSVAQNGLKTGTVTYKPQLVLERQLWIYAVKMSVIGTYENMKYLIDDFQRSEGMLVVDDIRFSSASGEEDALTLGIDLTFYLREDGQ